jgi:hypothetical protein
MRVIVAICLLTASIMSAHAQAVQRIEILEYGIYSTEADTASSTTEPGTAAGHVEEVVEPKLVQSTTTIPARVGVQFGFRYKIVGQSTAGIAAQLNETLAGHKDPRVVLRNVTLIPAPGIRNPTNGNVTMTSVFIQERRVGEELYRLYRLTEPWEVVPGQWTFEIWDGERKLVSQGFRLVAETPPASPKTAPKRSQKPAPKNSPPAQ